VLLLAPTPVSDVIEGCQVDARLRAVTAARRLMVHEKGKLVIDALR
jgi:hypothetical protein